MSSPTRIRAPASHRRGSSTKGGGFGGKDENLEMSLNPELDRKDNETAKEAIKNPLIGPMLSQVWFCALYSGDALRNQDLSRPGFELWLERSNFASRLVALKKEEEDLPPPPEVEKEQEGDSSSASENKKEEELNDTSLLDSSSGGADLASKSLSGTFNAAAAASTKGSGSKKDTNKKDDRNNAATVAAKKKQELAIKQQEEKEREERNALAEGMDAFDTQRRTRNSLTYSGFVRACSRLSFSWADAKRTRRKEPHINPMTYPIPLRVEELQRFCGEFCSVFLKEHRADHDVKGLGADEVYLNSREVDRLLYIYDDVFDRLFQRYRARDQHANRELTMEQNMVLDNYVELDEIREFLKDFGFFPKYISFVEISTCSQCACFGRLMVSPTKQLHGRTSDIQQNAAVKQFKEQQSLQEVDDVTEEDRAGVVNPLYLPSLPPEYLKDEPLLDKPRYMSCVVRIAQTLFNRSEFQTELPTIPARLEELFRVMQGPYERIMGHPMSDDCDYSVPGIPQLACANGSATAVAPQEVKIDGGEQITITGSAFGEKRGVFVKFHPPAAEPVILRATEVQRRRVICTVPSIEPGEVTMVTEETKEELSVGVKFAARVFLECSNDRLAFSQTDPPQCFYCVKRTKPRTVDTEVLEKLNATFSSLCAIGTDVTNTKFMIRSNWRRLKTLYGISERSNAEIAYDPNAADREIYFYQYAGRHEAMQELSMDFASYIATVCRCLYEEFKGKPGWFEKLAELANISFVPDTKPIANMEAVDQIEKELRYAQELLMQAEYRNFQEVDIFLGPILCGCVTGRAGAVSSSATGTRVIHEIHHPMLAYQHYDDLHTERILLQMAHVSQSYQQFLQRVVLAGFDIAAHHANPQTRKPFGRCWTLVDSETRTKLGVAWDYPGWFSSPARLPQPHCLHNSKATLTFYSGAEAWLTIVQGGKFLKSDEIPGGKKGIQMLYGVLAHKRCTSISHMRSMLQPHGIVFVSKLYSIPHHK